MKRPRLPDTIAKTPPLKVCVHFPGELGRASQKAAFTRDESLSKWLQDAAEMRLASGK